jgi:hypothetical protein
MAPISRAAPRRPVPAGASAPGAPISVGGVRVPRLDVPANRAWEGTFGQRALEAAYSFYDKTKVGRWVSRMLGQHEPDSPTELAAALATPLPRGADGKPRMLGDVTVVTNGMLNLVGTPPAMFRLALMTRGPLVIASSNPSGKDGFRLRPLTELWGVPVPPALKGKLFAIGDLSPNLMPWPQGSDLLLEQLSVVERNFGMLQRANPALGAKRSLSDAALTVVGYSQGAVSAAAARRRLIDAGQPKLIDRLITIAGAFDGTAFADEGPRQNGSRSVGLIQRPLAALLDQVNGTDGRRTLGAMDPDYLTDMRKRLNLTPSLVDLAYQSRAEDGGLRVEKLFGLSGKLLTRATGRPNDGVVTSDAPFGARVVRDRTPKTHLMAWKDWRTFDTIAEAL